ncbi:hypothetical protein [Microbacterium natoriense]
MSRPYFIDLATLRSNALTRGMRPEGARLLDLVPRDLTPDDQPEEENHAPTHTR